MATKPLRLTLGALLLLGLPGCKTTLPSSGPTAFSIQQPLEGTALPYLLINVSGDTIGLLAEPRAASFQGTFRDRRPPPTQRLGVGDVISVTVFEAAPGGLFTPAQTAGARPGNFVDLPTQAVDQRGNVAVPYAGAIRAAGRTIPEVQAEIEQRLQNRAIEPQVVVALREPHANLASVLGEVNAPGVFALTPKGERILSVIARAGGPRLQAIESYITLQRGGQSAKVLLQRLVNEPRENIFVWPNDTIFLVREAPTFIAVGASGQNGLFPFETEFVTLAQAVGRAGGLLDSQADSASVFVYRFENRDFLELLGADPSPYPPGPVPTIYNVNFRDPTGYLLATRFQLRDKDVIFVANALSVDFIKFLNVINAVATTTGNVSAAAGVVTQRWPPKR